jgi:ribosomal subunit interface protein
MKIQVNTDRNIESDERLAEYVEDVIKDSLGRFADQLTRVEVHLSDENAGKPGENDKRCLVEARLSGRRPTAVTAHANTVRAAIGEAVDKVERALERELGKLGQR